jgi:hypothetical protein
LVSNTWTQNIHDNYVVTDAWIAATVGKTTGKVGRMELDTPLVFTESWGIVNSTFEAGVIINQDIPDTTLVAAYVGQADYNAVYNGGLDNNVIIDDRNSTGDLTGGQTNILSDARNDAFSSFYNGAYAYGVVNNSFKPLTVQAWYFDAPKAAAAYWLQADLACEKIPGLLAGAQYTSIEYDSTLLSALTGTNVLKDYDNDAYAVMLGFDMKDMFVAKVAYSETGKVNDGTAHNLGAGGNLAGSQSKLYTEAWWNYGYVTAVDTSAWNVTIESPVNGMFDLGLYYTATDAGQNGVANGTRQNDLSEFTVTASKTVGPLDATLAYIHTKADDQNIDPSDTSANPKGKAFNMIQAYLTLNF